MFVRSSYYCARLSQRVQGGSAACTPTTILPTLYCCRPAKSENQNQQVDDDNSGASSSSSSSSSSLPLSFFTPVRSLLRLGEDSRMIRRALQTLNEEQLLRLASRAFTLHRSRIHAMRDLANTARWRLVKRSGLKWQLRSARTKLHMMRVRVRGVAALADVLVLILIASAAVFVLSGMRALSIWMLRMQYIESVTQNMMMQTVTDLEAHGGDGAADMSKRQEKAAAGQ